MFARLLRWRRYVRSKRICLATLTLDFNSVNAGCPHGSTNVRNCKSTNAMGTMWRIATEKLIEINWSARKRNILHRFFKAHKKIGEKWAKNGRTGIVGSVLPHLTAVIFQICFRKSQHRLGAYVRTRSNVDVAPKILRNFLIDMFASCNSNASIDR